jgi:hypothetical protein
LQERLASGANGDRIGHLDALGPKIRDRLIDVLDAHREVLSQVRRRRTTDEVHLLTAGVEPRTGEAEVGAVGALHQPEDVDVEGQRGLDIVDVDRHVVDCRGAHGQRVALGVRAAQPGRPARFERSRMPRVHITESTSLSPEAVLAAAQDFSPHRADLWPDVHLEHMEIHRTGPTFAEVTEGNPWPLVGLVWERLLYDWSEPGVITGSVIDSNLFKPGSTWELRAHREGDATVVELIAVRNLRGRGRLLWPLFPLGIAKSGVAEHLRHFLATAEADAAA